MLKTCWVGFLLTNMNISPSSTCPVRASYAHRPPSRLGADAPAVLLDPGVAALLLEYGERSLQSSVRWFWWGGTGGV